jgi:hypothetical protein
MKPFVKASLLAGLLAGTSDLIAAILVTWARSGNFPLKILHYIAGGLLGLEKSMQGGFAVATLGLVIHYFIACSWTLLFFILFPMLKFQTINKCLAGVLYGVFVGVMMTFVVLPLTRLPQTPFQLQNAVIGWLVLSVALGIPIAIRAYGYYGSKR